MASISTTRPQLLSGSDRRSLHTVIQPSVRVAEPQRRGDRRLPVHLGREGPNRIAESASSDDEYSTVCNQPGAYSNRCAAMLSHGNAILPEPSSAHFGTAPFGGVNNRSFT